MTLFIHLSHPIRGSAAGGQVALCPAQGASLTEAVSAPRGTPKTSSPATSPPILQAGAGFFFYFNEHDFWSQGCQAIPSTPPSLPLGIYIAPSGAERRAGGPGGRKSSSSTMSSSQPGTCPCQGAAGRPAILYALLSPSLRARPSVPPARSHCLCRQHRPVRLCAPHRTCREALDVLARTVGFLRNLPAFCQLPPQDQQRLLRGCWGPLFLLGLAQDTVTFEVAEAPVPSILKKILLEEPSSSTSGGQLPDRPQPSLAAVQWLRGCLESFWSLELGPKEYAFLKETILFNPGELPDTPGWGPSQGRHLLRA